MPARRLTIFGYHGLSAEPLRVHDFCFVDAQTFSEQVRAIEARFEVLPLADAVRLLRAGAATPRSRLPLAALTFDDGFQSVHDIALPLLVARGLPATCFVNTDAVGSATPLWFGRLHDALSRTRARSVTWGDSRWELDSPRSRERASGALQDLLKWSAQGLGEDGVPRIDTSVDAICRSLDVNPDQPCPADSPFRPCDEPSLHRLAASGLIEVGGHGRRHVILSQLNRAQQRAEIVGSVEAVRSMTGQRAGVFAYPNGLKHDYDEHTIAILRAVGVGLAVTARTGTCSETSPTMELPRVLLGARSWRETLAA